MKKKPIKQDTYKRVRFAVPRPRFIASFRKWEPLDNGTLRPMMIPVSEEVWQEFQALHRRKQDSDHIAESVLCLLREQRTTVERLRKRLKALAVKRITI